MTPFEKAQIIRRATTTVIVSDATHWQVSKALAHFHATQSSDYLPDYGLSIDEIHNIGKTDMHTVTLSVYKRATLDPISESTYSASSDSLSTAAIAALYDYLVGEAKL